MGGCLKGLLSATLEHTYTRNQEMGDFEGGPLKAKRGEMLLFPPLGGLQDEAQDDPKTKKFWGAFSK